MQWHGLKLPVIFMTFVLGLALVFAGQWAYKEYSYQQPLSKVLAENELVEDFTIKEGTSKSLVKVELSKDTSNLMVAYQEINQLINEVMGQKHYQIKFMSKSDNALNQAFYESHHIIYQAQVMGNYPEAAQKVEEAARKQGAEGKVFVDENNIYIQFSKTDGHYLYQIIPRQDHGKTVTTQGGGQIAERN
ncbi:conserved hypothetical protein [Desulforamulus reducens MI-1]|uniref:Uncharacterized protein n=2 Tax=Desulforamulus TaxID=2916693 RepID=A4J5U2_DESRM|nr:conserved hypothetical protein [Desulforamulus reducens MI-1]